MHKPEITPQTVHPVRISIDEEKETEIMRLWNKKATDFGDRHAIWTLERWLEVIWNPDPVYHPIQKFREGVRLGKGWIS